VLLHRTPLPKQLQDPRIAAVHGSLLEPDSLHAWMPPGAAIIHVAWSSSMSAEDHVRSARHLAEVATQAKITRFVHCSTAVVAGRTRETVVNENTACEPVNGYERGKYALELALASAAAGRFPLAIVRPTAIFGPGLQNLVALIESLRNGRGPVNYARATLFGRRRLHLVPVSTVVEALTFVALGGDGENANKECVRYIVSADEEPGGGFDEVESRLRRALKLQSAFPVLPLPSWPLRWILTLSGRSDTDPYRIYDASRLRAAGFRPTTSLMNALDAYAAWYIARSAETAEP
jgi:nucleoside-diphosphate-sugar epimerase